ncbi:MAG: hypothetical protein KF819_10705 [Labilithrix sp.]|nr:hypothetical protein [Labilithrix sp.]
MRRWLVTLAACLGCSTAHDPPRHAPAPPSATTIASDAGDAGDAGGASDAALAGDKLVPDEAVGPLLARLSENPGSFPSENYVTNETSLLHVAPTLRDPRLRGRAYVGVGPEQSYTYLAMLEPRVAYVVDIRRGNFLEHLMFRGCFEAGETRAAFLTALLSRRPRSIAETAGAGFAPLDAALRGVTADAALRDEGVARTRAVLDRLAVVRAAGDDKEIARIHEAFAKHGLSIAYTMLNSDRKYPTLAENFAARDPDGAPASFLASEETYARVRRLVLANRVLPVVGDFGGSHSLRAVADDMRARNLLLGVFYTSNVEQYLFESRKHGAFAGSVGAMPYDEQSRLVRVWFDQGRPHPAQRPGHRTTQITVPVTAFLDRAAKKPFRSYWDVVTRAE